MLNFYNKRIFNSENAQLVLRACNFRWKCEECNQKCTEYEWRKECNAKRFKQNFKNWTSGNDSIDKFIQDTQLSAINFYVVLITLYHKIIAARATYIIGICGITQDPEIKNYMMVMEYASEGSLRNYLNKNYRKLDWKDKFSFLCSIIEGLRTIHENDLIHRDLHINQKQKEIFNILNNWWINFDDQAELRKQIKEAGEINNSLTIPSTSLAIYTSRLFNFNNLPKPKNSIDYYDEQNDNIISRRFTESLQIDIFQLEISDVDETKSLQIDNIINKEFSESFQIDISQLEISDAGSMYKDHNS
ncbi:hypothetical protein RclHR1_15580002 [Rhizophagus clarus]|uniref:Serine-threonine/tyrosine-protein kinase catalytic domain-containing protein n=1 Tax=Rhizophagus clarus TaxID=94130 RepID=A0A2Z6QH77_9GLOM|nr:hypothetical protein RclHR1_15580002 [Rhizophagus clarus]